MSEIAHVVVAINILDIHVVSVVPAHWPSFVVPEPIAAVAEAVISAPHLGTPHVKGVVVTEMGIVIHIRNAAIMVAIVPVAAVAVVAAVVSNGLSLLPSGLLRLLDALGLFTLRRLLALRLCLALCLLGTLWLCSLGTLWLCSLGTLWLCSLNTLWLRSFSALRLCFLCMLRLLLVLRRLRFSSASALFLLAFLCERRDGGSEKQ